MRLGELLKNWRTMERLTLKEVSKDIGIPLPTLSRVEHGEAMDGKTLAKILAWATE